MSMKNRVKQVKQEKEFYTIPEATIVLGVPYYDVTRLLDKGLLDYETLVNSKKRVILKTVLVDYINKTIKVKV